MKKTNILKCKQKECLNNENGVCDELPPNITKNLKPNTIKCYHYATDFKKECNDMKRSGGILNAILKSNKRGLL